MDSEIAHAAALKATGCGDGVGDTENSSPAAASSGKAGKLITQKKIKAKRSKKPRDKPRRPLSAYNIYFQCQRAMILAKYECREYQEDFVFTPEDQRKAESQKKRQGGLFQALARTIANRWKTLPSEDHAEYQELAKIEMKQYCEKMLAYQKKQIDAAVANMESAHKTKLTLTTKKVHNPLLLLNQDQGLYSSQGPLQPDPLAGLSLAVPGAGGFASGLTANPAALGLVGQQQLGGGLMRTDRLFGEPLVPQLGGLSIKQQQQLANARPLQQQQQKFLPMQQLVPGGGAVNLCGQQQQLQLQQPQEATIQCLQQELLVTQSKLLQQYELNHRNDTKEC